MSQTWANEVATKTTMSGFSYWRESVKSPDSKIFLQKMNFTCVILFRIFCPKSLDRKCVQIGSTMIILVLFLKQTFNNIAKQLERQTHWCCPLCPLCLKSLHSVAQRTEHWTAAPRASAIVWPIKIWMRAQQEWKELISQSREDSCVQLWRQRTESVITEEVKTLNEVLARSKSATKIKDQLCERFLLAEKLKAAIHGSKRPNRLKSVRSDTDSMLPTSIGCQ